jgi:hypothetical protein
MNLPPWEIRFAARNLPAFRLKAIVSRWAVRANYRRAVTLFERSLGRRLNRIRIAGAVEIVMLLPVSQGSVSRYGCLSW